MGSGQESGTDEYVEEDSMSTRESSSSANPSSPSRRSFLKAGTAAVASAGMAGMQTKVQGNVLGANERIGVAMIGVGGRGTYHLDLLDKLKSEKGLNIELVAVCDAYRGRLDKAASRFHTKGYMRHKDLLDDKDVDVVGIATPDHVHGFQVIDAVHAGKDVFCEKPVTHWRQYDLTKRMVHEVQKSGRTFMAGTQGMSDGAWKLARDLVADGLIGQPIHAECGYFRVGDWGERGMPIDDPDVKPGDDLDWEAFLADAPKRPFDVSRYFRWRMYEDYSGGPVTDLFPHSLTPIVSILGVTFPEKVVGTGGKFRYEEREVPDTFNMLIDYPEKITVAVLGTQGNDYQTTGFRGAGHRIPVIRGWEGALTIRKDDGKDVLSFFPAHGSKKKFRNFDIPYDEDAGRFWAEFFECCRNKTPTASPVEMAWHVQTALQMAMLGLRNRTMATFNAETEEIHV